MGSIEDERKIELQCKCSGYIRIHKEEFDIVLITRTADDIFNQFL